MLQRFRVAMVDAERKQLSGTVEVDETLIGGVKQGGKRGRGAVKSVVVIAIEVKEPKGFGRVRMRHVPDASGSSLVPFVCDVTTPGSMVSTDGWNGYNGLESKGFNRRITVQSSSSDPAHVSMPGVHRVASLLKRWILGTHQGSIVPGTFNPIWRNLHSDSIGAHHEAEASYSEDCLSVLSERPRSRNAT